MIKQVNRLSTVLALAALLGIGLSLAGCQEPLLSKPLGSSTTPNTITVAPVVSAITATTAIVSWSTN